jgi:phospholipase/carboxylesterase
MTIARPNNPAPDPLAIHTHVWRPVPRGPGDDSSPSRTLLLLHGTGGDEHDLVPLAERLDPHANILSPRGNVQENGMARFFRRLREGVFDHDDVRRRAAELASWFRTAASRYGFDPARATAVGFSNGANIAAAVMLLHPGVIRSAVLLRAMVPLEPEFAPAPASKVSAVASESGVDLRPRVLLISGDRDPIVPIENATRLAWLLAASGSTVDHRVLDGVGHQLSHRDLEIASDRLSREVIGDGPARPSA